MPSPGPDPDRLDVEILFHSVGYRIRGRTRSFYSRGTARRDPAAALQPISGAKVILATVTSADALDSVQESPVPLIRARRSVKGWYSGTSIDSQDTPAFAAANKVRSIFPLERAAEAYSHVEGAKRSSVAC